MIDQARQAFKTYPELQSFPIAPNDSGEWCQCAECRKWDGDQAGTGIYSNRLIRLVNTIADALAKEFPDRKISTLAYANWVQPPTIAISPNVAVLFCPMNRSYLKKLTDPTDPENHKTMVWLKGWLDRSKFVYFYEYYSFFGLKYCPLPSSRILVEEYGDLCKMGLKGVLSELNVPDWDLLRLTAYSVARSGWNTRLGYDQILSDYCTRMYGPAAEPMRAYHDGYEQLMRKKLSTLTIESGFVQEFSSTVTPEEFDRLGKNITEAEAKIRGEGNPIFAAEVAKERSIFQTMRRLVVDPKDIPGIGLNLLANSGVEKELGPTGWFKSPMGGDYVLDIAKGIAHSGNRSLKIACTGKPGWTRWAYSSIPVKKGKRYGLSVWCRGPSGKILIWFNDPSDKIHLGWRGNGNKWVRVIVPEIEAKADSMLLCLETYDTGTVYYDDVFLAELPEWK
jgi:hypothetical protein